MECHDRITVIVPGTPVGKGRPKFARRGAFVQTYTPEKTANYEALVRMAAQDAMQGRVPFDGPVTVQLTLTVTPPASWSNKKHMAALAGEVAPVTKPDLDNSAKGVFDACNGIVWHDDKQVVEATLRKRYGMKPQAVMIVEPWTGDY